MKSKILVLAIALLGVCSFLYLESVKISRSCLYGLDDPMCNTTLYFLECILFLSFPVLLFSIVTYFTNAKIRVSWQRFTYWFVGLSILIILTFPESGGGGYISGGSITKATYGLLLAGLYFVIGVIVISRKWFQVRKEKA